MYEKKLVEIGSGDRIKIPIGFFVWNTMRDKGVPSKSSVIRVVLVQGLMREWFVIFYKFFRGEKKGCRPWGDDVDVNQDAIMSKELEKSRKIIISNGSLVKVTDWRTGETHSLSHERHCKREWGEGDMWDTWGEIKENLGGRGSKMLMRKRGGWRWEN